MLSVIIPAYNEEGNISRTARTINDLLKDARIPNEILFVNDGSKDGTWEEIIKAHELYGNIHGICFSRNFGKESAMFAGLRQAKGDCVVVIDCDLQHPPETIIKMYQLWQNGYEIVEGVKRSRGKESGAHGFAAKMFYKMISHATGIDMMHASDFKLLDRKAVNVLINMPEKNAFFRALSSWVGFTSTQVEYDVQERKEGESKWSTKSLIKYALTNITSFTSAPMQIVTFAGAVIMIITIISAIAAFVQMCAGIRQSAATGILLLQGFTSGVLMLGMGIMGYYIAKIYDEIKGRPRYIIEKEI